MARPSIEPEERLSEIFRVAMRPADKLAVFRAADLARMSPSEYGRKMLLTGKVVRVQTSKPDPATFDELRRIGVNLNQAVHKFHASGNVPPALARAAAAIEEFLFRHLDDGS